MPSELSRTDGPTAPRARRRRMGLLAIAMALVCFVAAACDPPTIPGTAPVRYRDAIFTASTKTADVTYGTAVNASGTTVTLKLDVYQPTGDALTSRPLVIFVHGGSFCCGNRNSAEILDEITDLTHKGFVAATIDYRLEPGGCTSVTPTCGTAITEAKLDAQSAVRFMKANAATYGVDASRVAIAGTSAGAITALNVAYGAPPGDTAAQVRGAVSLSGAALGTTPTAGAPPVIDFHGTADPLVPYAWAQRTIDQARAAHDLAYFTTWEGDGHVPYVQHRAQILDLTTRFLYQSLDLANAPT